MVYGAKARLVYSSSDIVRYPVSKGKEKRKKRGKKKTGRILTLKLFNSESTRKDEVYTKIERLVMFLS